MSSSGPAAVAAFPAWLTGATKGSAAAGVVNIAVDTTGGFLYGTLTVNLKIQRAH